jgi:hypothetical protein
MSATVGYVPLSRGRKSTPPWWFLGGRRPLPRTEHASGRRGTGPCGGQPSSPRTARREDMHSRGQRSACRTMHTAHCTDTGVFDGTEECTALGKNNRPGACNGASRPIDKAKHRGKGTCRACVRVCEREEVMHDHSPTLLVPSVPLPWHLHASPESRCSPSAACSHGTRSWRSRLPCTPATPRSPTQLLSTQACEGAHTGMHRRTDAHQLRQNKTKP